MTSRRNNNFTEKEIRGITMAVKMAKKSYPFITSWKLAPNYEKYNAHLYILLGIDINKLSEFINMEVKEYYLDNLDEGRIFSSLLMFFDWPGEYNSDEWNNMSDRSYNLKVDIKNTIKDAYSYLPEDMKIYYESELGSAVYKNEVVIDLDDFFVSK
jgi:hypothetical protein